ncbi:MAG: ABC transporter permease [Patescibacteria group bacterium]
MNIFESVKISLKLMVRNKMRTGLTVLGILIGISSIVIVFSTGEGIRSLINGQIESFGTNIIQTEVKVPSDKKGMEGEMDSASSLAGGTQVTTLVERDLEDLKRVDNIVDGYGATLTQKPVSYLSKTKAKMILGVSSSYIDIDNAEIDFGYFFTKEEESSLSQVVVLGSKAAEDIFGEEDPIGKFINIDRSKYTVIGVLKSRGATFGFNFDDMLFLPVKTLQKKIMGTDHYLYIVHQVKDPSIAEETAETMREILRENHNISDPDRDDFRVTTTKEMLDMTDTITNGITILLLLIVVISLIVGGVGILNVMYVIVSERTSEIGLRKAVGAKFSDIMSQFLIESVLITMIGAVFGISLGVLASFLICLVANQFGLDWEFVVPLKAFVVSILFAIFFGVVFGIFPARKAGKMDPVEALRKE